MATKSVEQKGSGLPKSTAAAISYVLGPITGVIFLVIEKDPFVRFHAMQSIVVLGALWVLMWVMPFTIILLAVTPIVGLAGFVLWLLLIYKAWMGEEWEVPYLGKYARKFLAKAK